MIEISNVLKFEGKMEVGVKLMVSAATKCSEKGLEPAVCELRSDFITRLMNSPGS
jgi:hypothetical protein